MSKLIKVYIVDVQIIVLQLMSVRKLLSFVYQRTILRELKKDTNWMNIFATHILYHELMNGIYNVIENK